MSKSLLVRLVAMEAVGICGLAAALLFVPVASARADGSCDNLPICPECTIPPQRGACASGDQCGPNATHYCAWNLQGTCYTFECTKEV
jgi:hypothetical protein